MWRMLRLCGLILVGYELRWFLSCRAQATVRVWNNGRSRNRLQDASRQRVCRVRKFPRTPSSARLQPGGGLQLGFCFQVCQAGQMEDTSAPALWRFGRATELNAK